MKIHALQWILLSIDIFDILASRVFRGNFKRFCRCFHHTPLSIWTHGRHGYFSLIHFDLLHGCAFLCYLSFVAVPPICYPHVCTYCSFCRCYSLQDTHWTPGPYCLPQDRVVPLRRNTGQKSPGTICKAPRLLAPSRHWVGPVGYCGFGWRYALSPHQSWVSEGERTSVPYWLYSVLFQHICRGSSHRSTTYMVHPPCRCQSQFHHS